MTRIACLLLVGFVSVAIGQSDNWIGKRVLVKKPGLKIGFTDAKGKQVFVAELTNMSYTVLGDREGFVKLHHRGAEGWVDKSSVLPIDDAIAYFTQKIAQDPRESLYYGYRGWAYREKGSSENALQDYDKAIALKPSADWYNNRGLIRSDRKQYDLAVVDFTEALKLFPKMSSAYENRGQIYLIHKNWDPALNDFSAAISISPNSAPAYFKRTQIYIGKGELAKALDDVTAGLKLEPRNHHAYVVRGSIHFDRKDYQKALNDFNQALQLEPRLPEAYFQRSRIYAANNDHARVIADLTEGLQLQPDNAKALSERGWFLFLEKKYGEASQDFDRALKVEPGDTLSLNNWAWMLATADDEKVRDGKRAVELAQRALELSKGKDLGLFDTLAAAHAEAGEFTEAIEAQTKALADKTLDRETRDEYQKRLSMYKASKAYRQP